MIEREYSIHIQLILFTQCPDNDAECVGERRRAERDAELRNQRKVALSCRPMLPILLG
jgi:hypothetical protein